MYVCMYMFMSIYIYYMYMYVCVYIYIYIYIYRLEVVVVGAVDDRAGAVYNDLKLYYVISDHIALYYDLV